MHRLYFTSVEHDALIHAMNRYMILDYQDKQYLKHHFGWISGAEHHFNMSLKSLELLYRAIMIEEINDNAFNVLTPTVRKGLFTVQNKIYAVLPPQLQEKYRESVVFNKC